MAEASDVAALPGGRFIVVGDKKDSAVIVDADGKRTTLDLPGLKNGKSQLEGVAYDPVRHNLFVSREESRELLRYEWNPDKKAAAGAREALRDRRGRPHQQGHRGPRLHLRGASRPPASRSCCSPRKASRAS